MQPVCNRFEFASSGHATDGPDCGGRLIAFTAAIAHLRFRTLHLVWSRVETHTNGEIDEPAHLRQRQQGTAGRFVAVGNAAHRLHEPLGHSRDRGSTLVSSSWHCVCSDYFTPTISYFHDLRSQFCSVLVAPILFTGFGMLRL